MPDIKPKFVKEGIENWEPYERDAETLVRGWAIPGMAGLEHRIGGLEKDQLSGQVSYDPDNHQQMTDIRAEKIRRIQDHIPGLKSEFASEGELLVVGWGGTYGNLYAAVKDMIGNGAKGVGLAHFNYINPLPKNSAEVFDRYKKVLVCELNTGQFASILRMQFPKTTIEQFNKIQGLPFGTAELLERFNVALG